MKTSEYVPFLTIGDRVRFIGTDYPSRTGQECTIIGILPNPSGRKEHQWYDIRFDDGYLGRFLEKYLGGATRDIPAKDWADFFERFSLRHENWLVQLDQLSADKSQQLSSRSLRLKSIGAEPPSQGRAEREAMIVIVGEDQTTEVSQLIRKPSRVTLSQTDVGADKSVEIHSDDLVTVLRFRAAVLPELVDDVA